LGCESIVGGKRYPDYISVYNNDQYEKLYESLHNEYLTNKNFYGMTNSFDENFVEKVRFCLKTENINCLNEKHVFFFAVFILTIYKDQVCDLVLSFER